MSCSIIDISVEHWVIQFTASVATFLWRPGQPVFTYHAHVIISSKLQCQSLTYLEKWPTCVICDPLFVTRLIRMEAVLMKVRRSREESHHIETSTPGLYSGPDTTNLPLRFSDVFLILPDSCRDSKTKHVRKWRYVTCRRNVTEISALLPNRLYLSSRIVSCRYTLE